MNWYNENFSTEIVCPVCKSTFLNYVTQDPLSMKKIYGCEHCGFTHTAESDDDMLEWIKNSRLVDAKKSIDEAVKIGNAPNGVLIQNIPKVKTFISLGDTNSIDREVNDFLEKIISNGCQLTDVRSSMTQTERNGCRICCQILYTEERKVPK